MVWPSNAHQFLSEPVADPDDLFGDCDGQTGNAEDCEAVDRSEEVTQLVKPGLLTSSRPRSFTTFLPRLREIAHEMLEERGANTKRRRKGQGNHWQTHELEELEELSHCIGIDPKTQRPIDVEEGMWVFRGVCNGRRTTKPFSALQFVNHCTKGLLARQHTESAVKLSGGATKHLASLLSATSKRWRRAIARLGQRVMLQRGK